MEYLNASLGTQTTNTSSYNPDTSIVLSDNRTMTASEVSYQILNVKESLASRMSQMNTKVTNLTELLGQLLDDEEIEENVAEQIADIFGISLEKTIEVTVDVTFNLTLTIGRGEDIDDIMQNLSFSVEAGYGDDVSIESEDYDIVDWNQDR